MLLIRPVQSGLPLRGDGGRIAVMHGGRRQEGEPGMPMRLIVVLKERGTPRLGVSDVVEALHIRGRVLGGLERRLGKRVVDLLARYVVAWMLPRSRCEVNGPATMPWRSHAVRMSRCASVADSRRASIHATT